MSGQDISKDRLLHADGGKSIIWQVVSLLAGFSIIALIDLPGLLKSKSKLKAIFTYLFLLIIGFALSVSLALDIDIISPAVIIEGLINFVLGK